MLASLPGVELRVVHLVRHPAGVAWSMKKGLKRDSMGVLTDKPPRPVIRSSVYWLITNWQAALVRRRVPASHSLRVRYEDLVLMPAETMSRIGRLLDCDLEAIGRRAVSGAPFSVEHTIAGNRLRMGGTVQLRMDNEWERQLSRLERFVCGAVTGCLAKLYGYQNVLGLS
jgi:hypothetical protein